VGLSPGFYPECLFRSLRADFLLPRFLAGCRLQTVGENAMVQNMLFGIETAKDRWRSVVPPYRPRGLPRITAPKPLPGQLSLPGIEREEELGGNEPVSEVVDQEIDAYEPGISTACPNCGGTEFDEDGDCTCCWEPAVIRPVTRRRQ
jgi:hypothetical protein